MTQREPEGRERCQALSMDGRLCRNAATGTYRYHGDHGLYSTLASGDNNVATWVRVHLCAKHLHATKP